MKVIPSDKQARSAEAVVQRATHLMWLERQLAIHQRWQRWLVVGWVFSLIASTLLFGVVLPFLNRLLTLPDEVTLVTAVGVGVELLVLLYLTGRVVWRRYAIETEIAQMLK
ncbi:MAG: hypothetical protein H7X77_03730 [Anaerolineae bacterium]|nr:hypothetical protein [Anaerolineae bacterium]